MLAEQDRTHYTNNMTFVSVLTTPHCHWKWSTSNLKDKIGLNILPWGFAIKTFEKPFVLRCRQHSSKTSLVSSRAEIQCNTFTKKQKNNASSHLSAILQYYNIIIMSFPYRVNSSSPRNVNYIVSSRLIFLRLLSSIVSLHLSPDAISYISSFVSSSVFLIPNRRSYLPLYRATFTLLTLPLCHTHFLCPPASAETSQTRSFSAECLNSLSNPLSSSPYSTLVKFLTVSPDCYTSWFLRCKSDVQFNVFSPCSLVSHLPQNAPIAPSDNDSASSFITAFCSHSRKNIPLHTIDWHDSDMCNTFLN